MLFSHFGVSVQGVSVQVCVCSVHAIGPTLLHTYIPLWHVFDAVFLLWHVDSLFFSHVEVVCTLDYCSACAVTVYCSYVFRAGN